MRNVPEIRSWVVYETLTGPKAGTRSLCTADEWRAIDAADPTRNQVIKEGIVDETEAEKLARGTSGDLKVRPKALRPTFE